MADDANYLKKVREHYEQFPYPRRNPAFERDRLFMTVLEAFDRLNYYCYGGARKFDGSFRVLIAGGGTGDAAMALAEQMRGRGSDVVYLDMSEASMGVAQQRARVRGLTNITWIRDSLLNIPKLGLGQFDYINCSGVLHHLADPAAGLSVLSDALKDDGAMGIMVYAYYGRMAVYQMQELLRMVNRGEENLQTQVNNVKDLFQNLPATSWLLNSPQIILDEARNNGDVGIYDLFLHTQDRAYTIPQLHEFVEGCGMQILQLFSDEAAAGNRLYEPEYYLRSDALRQRAARLSVKERQAMAELLHGKMARHTFYAAKRATLRPAADDLSMIPYFGFEFHESQQELVQMIRQSSGMVTIRQASSGIVAFIEKTPHLAELLARVNNSRDLRSIFEEVMKVAPGPGATVAELAKEFNAALEAFVPYQWLFLRGAGTLAPLYPGEMQNRVPL